jgi:drug/metabolite transporter (DMT)-like permease
VSGYSKTLKKPGQGVVLSGGGFALAALITGAMATGFTPIFVRLSELQPSATAFWRIALALPVFWLWVYFERRGSVPAPHPTSAAGIRLILMAGLFFAGDMILFNWAVQFTAVANASLLSNCAPIFVTLISWLFLRQRVSPLFLVGLLTALVGATLLIGNSLNLSLQSFFGDFLGVLTAMFYAGYILAVKYLRNDFSAATIMVWSGLVMCLFILIVVLLSGESLIPVTAMGWAAVLGLALVSQIGGQGMIVYGLAHLPASFSSVTLLVQPITATLLGWLILSETINPWQGLGGLIVLAGIYIARRGSRSS